MFAVSSAPSNAEGGPFALTLAFAALLVSLLAVIVPAATGRQQRKRDDRAKRGEMYLELMELVERHGLWVVDRTYDALEKSPDRYSPEMPLRRTEKPERTLRVRARAIVSAYASRKVADAFAAWQECLEDFEQELDELAFIEHEEGPGSADAERAKPPRDKEISTRELLADAVNAELVKDRRLRRRAAQ